MDLKVSIFANTTRIDLGKDVHGWNSWMLAGGYWYRGKGATPQEAYDDVFRNACAGNHLAKQEKPTGSIDGRTKEGRAIKEQKLSDIF